MNLLKQKIAQNKSEEQENKRKNELAEIEKAILKKRKELDEIKELRLTEKDNFAREVEGCFQLIDTLKQSVSELEAQKRELLKPVDGILDEAYELHTQAEAEKKESSTLFETAEVRLVESNQIFRSSTQLAESLIEIADSLKEIINLPSKDIVKAIGEIKVHTKNSLTYTKDISKAAQDVVRSSKLAHTAVKNEKANIELREEEIKKEKKHIASQQAAIRAQLGK